MSKRKLLLIFVIGVTLTLIAACGQAAAPETITIVETVEVEKEVKVVETVEVEKEVVVTKEVEVIKEVEKEGGVQEVKLVARCKATPPFEDGRCNNLLAGDNRGIALETIMDDADWGDYKTEFELASDAGEAPDIIVSGHEHIGDWATAGYLVDLTDEIAKYPEFADVIDSLWESTKLNNHTQ